MSERSDAPEGWAVPQRLPVLVAAGTIVALIITLFVAGIFYTRALKPETASRYSAFPAPGIETAIHEGANDPYRRAAPPAVDPEIAAAKREIVAQGLPGWEAQR